MSVGPGSTEQFNGPFVVGGIFNSVPPILVTGQQCAFQLDSSGNLFVNVAAGTISATNPSVGATGATAPTSATEIGVVDSTGKLQNVTGLVLTNAHAATVAIVDGSGNQITSFGGGVQFADAAASGAHPTGTQIIGWNKGGSTELAITALPLTNAQALTIAIVDGSGNQITSFGGGAQFAMGSVQSSSALGTIALGYDGTNVRGLLVSGTGQLHVIIDSATLGTVTVSGTVTANQGGAPWSVTVSGNVGVTQQTTPWTIQGDSASGAAKAGNPVQIGGVFNTSAPTVSSGQTVELQATSHGALMVATNGIDAFSVNAIQSGTWTVSLAGGASVNADIFGATGNALDFTTPTGSTPVSCLGVGATYVSAVPGPLATGSAAMLQCNTVGSLYVDTEGRKNSFRAVSVAQTIIASATAPTFSMTGSALRTIRIRKIRASFSAATGTAADVSLVRYSALSGGTNAGITIGKLDTNNSSPAATAFTWSVAATTATIVAVLASERVEIVTASVSVTPEGIIWTFSDTGEQSCVLRGTSDFIGIRFSAVGTTPLADIWIDWTEDTN
jgi:hypothetical protein